ncbi:hypothetical protein [Roseibium sp.]|uniref:hypothetical protein n=1 Tax=Roseibium sp. TaxID=1936156 RepID=UPI003A97D77A
MSAVAQGQEQARDQGRHHARHQTAATAQDRMQKLVAAAVATARLRDDYQLHAAKLPLLLEVAAEIQKHKDEADHAAEQAYAKTFAILEGFCEKTGKLSDAMLEQHEAVKDIVDNPQDLPELLRSGRTDFISALARHGPIEPSGQPQIGGQSVDSVLTMLKAAENQAQGQMSDMTARLQSMVAAAVEEKTSEIRQFVETFQQAEAGKRTR